MSHIVKTANTMEQIKQHDDKAKNTIDTCMQRINKHQKPGESYENLYNGIGYIETAMKHPEKAMATRTRD